MPQSERKRLYGLAYKAKHKVQLAEKLRDWRARNPEKVQAQWLRLFEKRIARTRRQRAQVSKLKGNPCSDCGGKFHPAAMDFDHVRGVKTANVCQLVSSGKNITRILSEIAKCDLVCANCHRVRTFNRRQHRGTHRATSSN